MNIQRKYILLFTCLLYFACGNVSNRDKVSRLYSFGGKTMGTTYSIKYFFDTAAIHPDSIAFLLENYNLAVSTYIEESVISKVNGLMDSIVFSKDQLTQIFEDNYRLSRRIYEETKGKYDPTVMPLVNYYGFGYHGKNAPSEIDTARIDSIRKFIGLDKIYIYTTDSTFVVKKKFQQTQIDFSSVAKGDGVDKVGEYLERKGIHNYLVEIGGECRARGTKPDGGIWVLGLSVPEEGSDPSDFLHYVELKDRSMATSGNYRNFRENRSGKFGHTINPISGFPEMNSILSATVLSPDCASADAWATAIMLMGREKTDSLLKNFPYELLYIYSDDSGNLNTVYSDGFEKYLVKN